LLLKIKNLESELQKQFAVNMELSKKLKHRRTSSEDKTVIFNQTNISSYYPIIMMPKGTGWVCKQNLKSHLDSVRALAWHGEYLISSGEDSLVKVWENGNLINTVR
jgi:WD40 repeat protein